LKVLVKKHDVLISYVPVGIPFLEVLADHVLQETDPLRLASYQILLPTPKACHALKQILLKKKGRALVLPRIQALGNLNADDMVLQGGSVDLLKGRISERRRHLLLTHLIATHRSLATEQAALLASTLLQFLNDLAWEGIALDAVDFDHLVASDYALHWQITGDFLKLIQQEWPKILAAENTLEPYAAENFLLDDQAHLWAATPPPHPVIIAGSRGSRPATARLIQQVAALPQGHIILQGLVPSDCVEDLAPTHPQADLQKLLRFLEIPPHRVQQLGNIPNRPSRILEAAFQYAPAPMETIHGISVAECSSSQQEAEVIALALRQVLETPHKTGLLITQDASLARRVRMALQRWNIQIRGSKMPLSQTPLGSLVALTAQWIQPNFDLGIFLATLKHPLVHQDSIDQLEMEVIRKGAWSWDLIVCKSKGTTLEPFVQELANFIKNCQDLAKASHVSFAKVMDQHQKVLAYLLQTDLWPVVDCGVEYAAEIQTFWADLKQASEGLTISMGTDYAKLLARYLDDISCKANYTHDRIQILGLMEARLLHADLVILGGLNQGSWPQNLPADPWFNRATRQKLGLTPPEERIGISAHDFVQAGAASEILLTRSLRVDGTPTVPSSFLVKVQTWLHQQGHRLPVAQDLLDWSMPLLESRTPMVAPAPKPPVEMRPRTLSISDMATWVQNPYGIYAKHVLGLRPLPSPFEHNSALVFGTMAHEVLQKILPLVQAKDDNIAKTTETIWYQYENQFIPHERIFWHWRLQQIVDWFVALPDNLQGQTSYAEASGQIKIGDFTIKGKIDRIDIQQGNAHVIDYKTGVLPSTGFVKYGISPQLLLEAWMVQDGLMQAVPQTPVSSASLWRLPMGWQNDTRITLDGENLDMFLVKLQEKVERLVTLFNNPDTPYLCHPRGKLYPSPYDHLARFQEWSTQDNTQDSAHE
jgi:ATP-dependent helicase/nuclease subunit B